MLQVLIVDDDRLIREEVRLMLDWEKHGFMIHAEADNGMEAMQILDSNSIDIVLTDIHMPLMNGVMLIKSARDKHPYIKFLVMSNFDDFEYVKDAMKYGASEYVLKYKLDETILLSLFHQLKKSIQQEREQQEIRQQQERINVDSRDRLVEKYWLDLLDGFYTEETAASVYNQLALPQMKGGFFPILLEIENKSDDFIKFAKLTMAEENIHWVRRNHQQWLILIYTEEKSYLYVQNKIHAIAQAFKSQAEKSEAGAIIVTKGSLSSRFIDLVTQYHQLIQFSANTFYTGINVILDNSTAKKKPAIWEDSVQELLEAGIMSSVQLNNMFRVKEQLAEIYKELSAAQYDPEGVRDFFGMLVTQLNKLMKAAQRSLNIRNSLEDTRVYIHSRFATLNQILIRLEAHIAEYIEGHQTEHFKGYRDEIRKAISYMETHYREEITLNDVSEHINLSKNHFCKLFKQETGENFVNHMNAIRIEQAKLLILQSNDRIKEIADKVGLGNYRYFCKVFKQLTGYRPLDYKHAAKQR